MRARVISLAMALFVALLWGSPQSVEYLCAMSESPADECCCPHDEEPEPELAQEASLDRPPCCVASDEPAPATPMGLVDASDSLELVAMLPRLEPRLSPPVVRAVPVGVAWARGPPPPRGPPPFKLNCRFVI